MKKIIQTPDGPRSVPDWAKCYCVTRHSPQYIHPYPFALPSGDELWLCPNTYHQARTLLSLYQKYDGPPRSAWTFNYFVRSLITMYWSQVLDEREDQAAYEAWKAEYVSKGYMEMFDEVKKTVAHE